MSESEQSELEKMTQVIEQKVRRNVQKTLDLFSDELKELLGQNLEQFLNDRLETQIQIIVFSLCREKIAATEKQCEEIIAGVKVKLLELEAEHYTKIEQLQQIEQEYSERLNVIETRLLALPKPLMNEEEAFNYAKSLGATQRSVTAFTNWAYRSPSECVKRYGIRVKKDQTDDNGKYIFEVAK